MVRIAIANLLHGPARLALSVGGVALALTLILALDAIFAGSEERITAYIDESQADVWVAQSGVRNLHMAASALPAGVVATIEEVDGVASVTPILYVTSRISVGASDSLAYVIGLPAEAQAGRPWRVTEGSDLPALGEVVLDAAIAEEAGAGLGDGASVLGRRLVIAGLAEGSVSITNSIAYISLADFAELRGAESVSFVLVQAETSSSAREVADAIEAMVPGVTALAREEFAAQERRVVRDMATDILAIMNTAGFLIGLAVMALSVYTATLSRRAEYGVLKALGARAGYLYGSVVIQALLATAAAFALGLAITLGLSLAAPRLVLGLQLTIAPDSLIKVGALALVIAASSAFLPVRQIAGLDPALVFRKGGTA